MKRITILVGIFILLGVFSCDKKEEITGSEDFPAWLREKITSLIHDQNLCDITDVTIIEYNGKRYYHLYAGLWSCMYCQLFDEQGNYPNWESDVWNDFFAKKKDVDTVPACN